MKPIFCPCGLEKQIVAGLAVCTKHCDVPCLDRFGCPRCKAFTLETRKRTDAEYKQEKANG